MVIEWNRYGMELEYLPLLNFMTNVSTTTATTVSKPVKEVLIIRDEGFFTHPTGDTYDGEFEIKKKDLVPKMLGRGVYMTVEGDMYTGTWENDKLGGNEMVTVTFADATSYEGTFKDWCYAGAGKYTYPDESVLNCSFVDNCPTGPLTLTDPNGHTWLGKAEQGYGWLEPVNHFYTLLDKRESPKMKQRLQRRRMLPEIQNDEA